jgi:hypothetical protein
MIKVRQASLFCDDMTFNRLIRWPRRVSGGRNLQILARRQNAKRLNIDSNFTGLWASAKTFTFVQWKELDLNTCLAINNIFNFQESESQSYVYIKPALDDGLN